MKIVLALAALSLAGSLGATTIEDALRPLDQGVPEVAVVRLQELLGQRPPPRVAAMIRAKLGQALVETGHASDALQDLDLPGLMVSGEASFWRAQAFAALDRWPEALAVYQQVAARSSEPLHADAIFGEAQCFRALGQRDQAAHLFDGLRGNPRWRVSASLGLADLRIDRGDLAGADRVLREIRPERLADRNERRYLFGRIHLAQHDYARAIQICSVLLQKPESVSHSLLIATLFGIADAHLGAKTPEEGDDVLEEFIDHHPADDALPAVFEKLDAVYRAEQKPSPNELEKWARDRAEPRRALAQWYLAQNQLRAGDREGAFATLLQLRGSPVRLPSLGEAYLELARLFLERHQWDAAIATAEEAGRQNADANFAARVAWLIAQANYRASRLEKAATIFDQIAKTSPAWTSEALFNAALCWLRLDQAQKFSSDYRLISNDPAKRETEGELLLEEGTLQAGQGRSQAAASFQKFIHDFPDSPRLAEAWVALAELAYHARKPDLEAARTDLARARAAHPSAAASERADYLNIWLEDAAPAPNESRVVTAASVFLQQHPSSKFIPEVRMKLAEAYFRLQDFANAQTQFELIAQQNPGAPLAEKALFFAARSAMSSMGADALDHALALFDQVGKLNGDLKWAARNEQAAIERRLGKPNDALAIYDEVLKNPAKPADRREALCGKGDVLCEMGAADPQNYRRAIELYDQLAQDPGVPAHWRNQAEFKKGEALEKLNNKPAALTTYYGVIEAGAEPAREHEFFWFYKAGFNAAHLLEEASDWKSAVAVYRQLAAAGGARSDEAKARLTQLRLEHFLWDE
jgi:TolA-binding protein